MANVLEPLSKLQSRSRTPTASRRTGSWSKLIPVISLVRISSKLSEVLDIKKTIKAEPTPPVMHMLSLRPPPATTCNSRPILEAVSIPAEILKTHTNRKAQEMTKYQ